MLGQISGDIQTLGIAVMATLMILREVSNILNSRNLAKDEKSKDNKPEVRDVVDSALHQQAVLDRLLSILRWQEQTGIIINRMEQRYDLFVREGCPNRKGTETVLEKVEEVVETIKKERND